MQTTETYRVKNEYRRAVAVWLLCCLVLIGFMVSVGGYTRLTGSGLSITEWKPIHGTIPPLNLAEWQEEFDKYRQIPQYQQINKGMSLDEFKAIYWPEYWHRNLGRLIGLIYALPFFFFLARGAFSRPFATRLFLILLLGGAQGGIGWIMVASGLEERLYVSHIKLALHFGMAMLLAAAVCWSWLDVRSNRLSPWERQRDLASSMSSRSGEGPHPTPLPEGEAVFLVITLLIYLQLVMGAMVAGLHAGLIYNTFPTMNGDWIAPDVFVFDGSWFDHIPLMQFIHRWLAKLIVLLAFVWWWFFMSSRACRGIRIPPYSGMTIFFLTLFAQFVLGVLTLINVVPLHWAMLHQLGGFLLLLCALNVLHGLRLTHNNSVQVAENHVCS